MEVALSTTNTPLLCNFSLYACICTYVSIRLIVSELNLFCVDI
uniref:Uncharacterized protein n=1 Tax=Rhizophora mucronata TaxID=61149 RepID=A0A2P2KLW1_RHIMU